MKTGKLLLLLALMVCQVTVLQAQTLDHSMFTTNGIVNSSVQNGNTLYLGGSFTQMGYGVNKFAHYLPGSTKPDLNFPQLDPNSTLNGTEPDGNGGYYLYGYIYNYNGVKFNTSGSNVAGVIHILSDYSLDPAFIPTEVQGSQIYSLKKKGNRLYIGGYFSSVNGINQQFLAAIDASTGTYINWVPDSPDNYVDKIEVSDSLVYIHGIFSSIGGNYATGNFASVKTGDGKYNKTLSSSNNAINSFKINNNKLYLAGTFTSIGYQATGLASVNNTSASADLNFPATNGSVYATLADGTGGYYIGGSFTQVGNQYRTYLAHILSNGTVDPTFSVDLNNQVQTLTSDGTNLYIGGFFSSVNSTPRNYAAAVLLSNGALTSWNPAPDLYVNTLIYVNGTIYMGGYFSTIKGTARNYAGAVTTANALTSWAPNPDYIVKQIIANNNGSSLFLCGNFSTVKGATHPYIARVNNTNGTPASWNPNPSGGVNAIALSASKIYLGGVFTSINGVTRQYLASVDTTSNNPNAFQADANSYVYSLNISNNKLYVGGEYSQLQNTDHPSAARIDLTSNIVDSWNPGIQNGTATYAFATSGVSVIVGGSFTLVNAADRSNLAAIDLASNQLSSFKPNVNSWTVNTIDALCFSGNELFAGGYFNYYNPNYSGSYNSLISLDTLSGNVARYFDYLPQYGNTVNAITVSNNRLYAGGTFSVLYDSSNTNPISRYNFVSYDLSTTKLTSEVYDPNSNVRSLVADAMGSIIAAGDFTLTNYVDRTYLGAINLTNGQATNWKPAINGGITSMALKDTSLFIGGGFDRIYNSDYTVANTRNYIGAVSTNSGLATPWNADLNSPPTSMALADSILYIGGSFINIKGIARNYAAAVGTGGTGTVKAWAPNPNSYVYALVPSGSNVYIGGIFSTVKGITRNYLALVNNTNGNLNSWNPNPNSYINSLSANATTLYATGQFTTISGQNRNSIVAFNIANNTLTQFNPRLTNTNGYTPYILATANYGKTLFMGSDGYYYNSMDSIKGAARHILGTADTATGNATAFNPNPDLAISSLNAGSNKLFVSGSYTSLAISPNAAYFNVFTLEPLTQSSALNFTNLQPTSVSANFTAGSGEGRFVSVKAGSTANAPSDGNGYNANAIFGQGSNLGGSYAVYKNYGSNVNVTNLLPNHTYYFGVFEYNGSGQATEYLQSPALTGSVTTPCPTYTNIVSPAGPLSFCQGDSATLTALAGFTTYSWSNTATIRSIVVKTSGSYTVNIIDSNGCSATSAPVVVTVNAKPIPIITPSGPVSICQGDSTTLTASAEASYLWSNTATTQSIKVKTAGSYSVTETNAAGCSATSSAVIVNVNALPKATISASGPTTNLCPGATVTLTASAGTSYFWSNSATTRSIIVNTAGSYTVTVFNASGCSAISKATKVTYLTCGKPVTVATVNITGTSAQLKWKTASCAVAYQIQYRKGTTGAFTTITTPTADTTYTLNGLLVNTAYQWKVATICQNSPLVISAFSALVNFITAASFDAPVADIDLRAGNTSFSAMVFPNPATSTAVLRISGSVQQVTVTLTDVTGKILWESQNIKGTQVNLPVEQLTAGVYLVNVSDGSHSKVLKLVKE